MRRLEQSLQAENTQVIHFDSLEYITETEKNNGRKPAAVGDGWLGGLGRQALQARFPHGRGWTRFANWLQTEVEITGVTAAGLSVKLKEQQATVAGKIRTLSSPLEWTKQVQQFAGEIVEFVRQRSQRERVVVIVDSLERLRGVSGADQDAMFQHVVATFAGDFDRLRVPGASVVYVTPPYLALLADVRNFITYYSLASVRVYCKPIADDAHTPERRQPRPDGLEKMRRLIERRFAEWALVIDAGALNQLTLASGGDLRHFMQRLVSGVVGQAQFALDRLPLEKDDDIQPLLWRLIDAQDESAKPAAS